MVLTMQDQRFLVFIKEAFQLDAQSQWWEIIEKVQIHFRVSLNKFNTTWVKCAYQFDSLAQDCGNSIANALE